MPRSALRVSMLGLAIDNASKVPLKRQLYDQLRTLILTRRLATGSRVPATRTLAQDLRCSRNTLNRVFERLLAEGYLEARPGSGTYVAEILPESYLQPLHNAIPVLASVPARQTLSERGRQLAALGRTDRQQHIAFAPALPDVLQFPFDVWHDLYDACWRNPLQSMASHFDEAGYRPLREAVAAYLKASRFVDCDADQVIITTGSQHGIDLAARLLLDPGDEVWVEDPGYPGVRGPLTAAGARLIPVPVDRFGLNVQAGVARAPGARMAMVTPSHQYPLGMVMPMQRRFELLEHAARSQMWIVEDDYDSEFRYSSNPVPALQGLDRGERVIYVGTLSKIMFPALRLGYMVIPKRLVPEFLRARGTLDVQPGIVLQPVLAKFIAEGHLSAHVRRMRGIYQRRQSALLEALRQCFGDDLQLQGQEAGLHLVVQMGGELARRLTDVQASRLAGAHGILAKPLSAYCLDAKCTPSLLLGYGCVDEPRIVQAVRRLHTALTTGAAQQNREDVRGLALTD